MEFSDAFLIIPPQKQVFIKDECMIILRNTSMKDIAQPYTELHT